MVLARRFARDSLEAGKTLLKTAAPGSASRDVRVLPVLYDAVGMSDGARSRRPLPSWRRWSLKTSHYLDRGRCFVIFVSCAAQDSISCCTTKLG